MVIIIHDNLHLMWAFDLDPKLQLLYGKVFARCFGYSPVRMCVRMCVRARVRACVRAHVCLCIEPVHCKR